MEKKERSLMAIGISLAVLLTCFVGCISQPSEEEKPILVVGAYGGEFEDKLRESFINDFEKEHNCQVLFESGVSSETTAKLIAQKADPQMDVVILDIGDKIVAEKEGLLAKISEEDVPNMKNLYDIAKDPNGYGPVMTFDVLILAYNTNYIKETPTSWNEMWKPEYKNKINLFSMQIVIGYDVLIMAAMLKGGGIYNLEPGWEYLEELKPNVNGIVTSAAMTLPAVATGEIWLLPFWNARTQLNIDEGAPIGAAFPKEGGFVQMNTISIVKNCKHLDLAKKFVNTALSEKAQKRFAELMYYGPTNKNVKLSTEVAERTVYGPEAVAKLLVVDIDYVNKHRAEWVERFNQIFGG